MPLDFYTYRGDIRPFGNGSVITYLADATLTDLAQGEMSAWDSAAKVLKRFVRDGSAGHFVGISRDSQTGMAKLGNESALAAFVANIGVFSTGIHQLVGLSGDSFTHGVAVYMSGVDTTKVTVTAGGGVQVGTVHLPDGSTIVGDGSKRVSILIDEFTITQA